MTDSTEGDAEPQPASSPWRLRTLLPKVAPWLVTGVVLFFLLRKYPLQEILQAAAKGSWLPMIPLAIASAIGLLFPLVAWDTMVLRGYLGKPGYWDVFGGKAATSMLLLIGYTFGHGGYGVWIARRTGTPASEAVGLALYIAASDLAAICMVAGTMIHFGGADVPTWLAITTPIIPAVLIALILIGPFELFGTPPRVFRPWSVIPPVRGLLNIGGRCINITGYGLITWAATRGFGLQIPLERMVTYLPIVLLIGSLPVNVAGLGAVQAVWVMAFKDHAPGAALVAFQFIWYLMLTVCIVVRGLPFLRRVVADIDRGAPNQA